MYVPWTRRFLPPRPGLFKPISEPAGFEEGFREPILKLHPEPPSPRYSDRKISIEDYLKCNPCETCQEAGRTVCDAKIPGCITTSLYEPDLPSVHESRVITHSKHCDLSRAINPTHILIVCNRGGMSTLQALLREIHPGYTTSQQEYTDSEGKNTLLLQSCLPNYHTVHASTEFLKTAATKCRTNRKVNIHFTNFEDFGISKHRLQRIFHDKMFTLNIYERNQLLFKITPNHTSANNRGEPRKPVPPTMPPKPKPTLTEPGLPKSLSSPEVKKNKSTEKQQFYANQRTSGNKQYS